MKNKTKRRNRKRIILAFAIASTVFVILLLCGAFDVSRIWSLKSDFQYNLASMSAVVGGFLFTSLSILLSSVDRPSVARLYNYHYLDDLYIAAIIGVIAAVVTMAASILIVLRNAMNDFVQVLVWIEMMALITEGVFFCWCLKRLCFVISKAKQEDWEELKATDALKSRSNCTEHEEKH